FTAASSSSRSCGLPLLLGTWPGSSAAPMQMSVASAIVRAIVPKYTQSAAREWSSRVNLNEPRAQRAHSSANDRTMLMVGHLNSIQVDDLPWLRSGRRVKDGDTGRNWSRMGGSGTYPPHQRSLPKGAQRNCRRHLLTRQPGLHHDLLRSTA